MFSWVARQAETVAGVLSPPAEVGEDGQPVPPSLSARAGHLFHGAVDLGTRAAVMSADVLVAAAVAVVDTVERRPEDTPVSAEDLEAELQGLGAAPDPPPVAPAPAAPAPAAAVTRQPSDPDDCAPPAALARSASSRRPHPARLTRKTSSRQSDGMAAHVADAHCGCWGESCSEALETGMMCCGFLFMAPMLVFKVGVCAGPIVLAFLVPCSLSVVLRWPYDTACLYFAVLATARLGPVAKVFALVLVTPVVVVAPLLTFAALLWTTLACVIGMPVCVTLNDDDDDGNFFCGYHAVAKDTLELTQHFFNLQARLHDSLTEFRTSSEQRIEVQVGPMLLALLSAVLLGPLLVVALMVVVILKTPFCVVRAYYLWARAMCAYELDGWICFVFLAYAVLNALIPVFSALALCIALVGCVIAGLVLPVVAYEKGPAAAFGYMMAMIGDVWEFSNMLICPVDCCYEAFKCRGCCGKRTHAHEYMSKGATWLTESLPS